MLDLKTQCLGILCGNGAGATEIDRDQIPIGVGEVIAHQQAGNQRNAQNIDRHCFPGFDGFDLEVFLLCFHLLVSFLLFHTAMVLFTHANKTASLFDLLQSGIQTLYLLRFDGRARLLEKVQVLFHLLYYCN